MTLRHLLTLLMAVNVGCASSGNSRLADSAEAPHTTVDITLQRESDSEAEVPTEVTATAQDSDNAVLLTTYKSETQRIAEPFEPPEFLGPPEPPRLGDASEAKDRVDKKPAPTTTSSSLPIVSFDDVIASVHRSYPLVQAAFQERQIANGNQIAAWGAFDTKLKAASENGPLGFYETYRTNAGFTTPVYGGGEFFGGYRNGGGSFQPWYQERETNDGGEFKGGVRVPLIRDRAIDARRAEVWRANYDQQIADPVIRASLVQFANEAGLAYWKWVATGRKYQIGQQWLELAQGRNHQIERRVELQDLDPPELIDNQRAIAKRQAKLAASLRDFQQAAVKLSLFLRDSNGQPVVPSAEAVPEFPALRDIPIAQLDHDIRRAQERRPELTVLSLQLQRLRVDYAEAHNLTRPSLDAQLVGSQDVGQPTSSTRDKSEFEIEVGLFFEVPLQRRKGRGKMQAVQAKMAQVSAKRRMVGDKVAAEVQFAYAGLIQSRDESLKAREAVTLASRMAAIERIKFDVGESDLLKVALREQYALEAAEEEISATYNHFSAFAEYAAILAIDRPGIELLP